MACDDPCKTLAKRICNCEPTNVDRRACEQDRITNQEGGGPFQKSKIEITDADREVCAQKLETCDCQAVDQNDLEKCGFVREGKS